MYTIVVFTIVIGILIFVHEFGHFIAARLNGIRVEKFSLGFGPKIIGKKIGETEYLISAVPLGGYVKMAGQEDLPGQEEVTEKSEEDFSAKTVLQRASVVLAGPFMNIVLAFVLMPLVFFIGVNLPSFIEEKPVIGWIEKDSPALAGGFQVGDKILRINKKEVSDWDDTITIITTHPELGMKVDVERAGEIKELSLIKDKESKYAGPGYAGLLPEMAAIVGRVNSGYPAEKAGLKTGDRIIEIDESPVVSWYQVSAYIRSHVGQAIEIEVKRGEEKFKTTVTPVKDKAAGYGVIGIINRQETILKKFDFFESIEHGAQRSVELTVLTFDVLKRLVTLNLSIESLGGPIMIAKLTGEAAQSGVSDLIAFMAFMSLQLGVLNLLPIPVLDGGWVVFLIIEKIKGSPLNKRTMEITQTAGFALLITLIVIVSYNDIMRVFK